MTAVLMAALGLAGLAWIAASQHRTLARLRQQTRDQAEALERLRAENARLAGLGDQQAEISQLRDNTRDLMRLRNEVRQLREQQQETELLKAANARLLQVVQGLHLSPAQQATVAAVRAQGAALGIIPAVPNPLPPSAAASGDSSGVRVAALAPNSPVLHSDLKVGDVIIRVDGQATETLAALQTELLTKKPGDTVLLDVIRSNEVLRIPVKTRELPR
jgi:TolA-binding protein